MSPCASEKDWDIQNRTAPIKIFLNDQQHKVDISTNYFFPFIPFVNKGSHKFGGKCDLAFYPIIVC